MSLKSAVVPLNIDAVCQLIFHDRFVPYGEIEAYLDISLIRIHSILHGLLFALDTVQFDDRAKRPHMDWCKKVLQKMNRCASKDVYKIVTGNQSWMFIYTHTRMYMNIKLKSNRPYESFKISHIQQKTVHALNTSKEMVTSFLGITEHVATVPLEQRRTVNSEWYTSVCLPEVFGKKSQKMPQQCKFSHINSNKNVFKHSQHRFDVI